jgi:hypothetical protein
MQTIEEVLLMKTYTSILLAILVVISMTSISWAEWTRDTVGLYTRYYEVKVADGRNDNVQRVYCCCYNGHVVEWSFDGSDWTMVDCGTAPPGPDNRLISMWIGDGRGDGLNRLYSACANGSVYEFSYSGGAWIMGDLGTPGVFYAGQIIGQPRNDDTNRVCAGGWNTPVREYTWNGTSWDALNVSSGNRYIWPLDIAQGRNDGIYRVYAPDWYQYYLREYSWNGAGYDEVNVSAPQPTGFTLQASMVIFTNSLTRVATGNGLTYILRHRCGHATVSALDKQRTMV